MKQIVLLFCLIIPAAASAQDLGETLSNVGQAYAEEYVDPLLRALGSDLNGGLMNVPLSRGKVHGLDVYFGIKVLGTPIGESERRFDLTYSDRVTIDTYVEGIDPYIDGTRIDLSVPATFTVRDAPTVFGPSEVGRATVHVRHDTVVTHMGRTIPVSVDTSYTVETIGGLTELSMAPLPVPHLELGTLFGTSVMVRWLPTLSMNDVGSIGLSGFGLRHDIGQYIPGSTLDVAVQAMWQNLRVADSSEGEVLHAATSSYTVSAGKRFGIVSLYGGLQVNSADMEVSYRYNLSTDDNREEFDIAFSNDRSGQVHAVIGGGVHAGPLNLALDVGFGSNPVYGLSLGILL